MFFCNKAFIPLGLNNTHRGFNVWVYKINPLPHPSPKWEMGKEVRASSAPQPKRELLL